MTGDGRTSIATIGHVYVGMPVVVTIAEFHDVIGHGTNGERIIALSRGRHQTVEAGPMEMVHIADTSGNFFQ